MLKTNEMYSLPVPDVFFSYSLRYAAFLVLKATYWYIKVRQKSIQKSTIHTFLILRICCVLRVAVLRGRTLKNCGKKMALKFFTSQLVIRNSQPSQPGSKKLAMDLGPANVDKFP